MVLPGTCWDMEERKGVDRLDRDRDGTIPTSEPRLSALAIAVARSKGKGWIVPSRAMERSNQDYNTMVLYLMTPRIEQRIE